MKSALRYAKGVNSRFGHTAERGVRCECERKRFRITDTLAQEHRSGARQIRCSVRVSTFADAGYAAEQARRLSGGCLFVQKVRLTDG